MSRIVRVEFTLSMPSRASWNGEWSGAGKHYAIVRCMAGPAARKLMDARGRWSWRFSDGWVAAVTARVLEPGERAAKSSGFCGYDWMVHSICTHGEILDEQAIKARADLAAVRMDVPEMHPTTEPKMEG